MQRWLGLFPVSWQQLPDERVLEVQIATISAHLQGSCTDLLQAMVQDTGLQSSLNGLENRHKNADEYVARERLELLSLAEGIHREQDASKAATSMNLVRRLWARVVGVRPTGGQLEALAGRWRQQGTAA